MPEQQLKAFAEAAERHVPVPDLDELASRGRDLRRLRMTLVASAAVLAVAAGAVLASVQRDDRTGPPTGNPQPSEIEPQADPRLYGQEALTPGELRYYLPSVFGEDRVWLRPPAGGWDWWGQGAAKFQTDGTVPEWESERYARYTVLPLELVARRPCVLNESNSRWADVGDDPTAAAEKIGRIPGFRVVQRPEATERFGVPVVHIGVELRAPCPNKVVRSLFKGEGAWIWGTAPGDYQIWIAQLPHGGLVMVAADHHPDVAPSYREQLQALVDSTRIDDGTD